MGRVITARGAGVHSWWNVQEACRICAWNLLLLPSKRRALDGFLAFLLRLFASISRLPRGQSFTGPVVSGREGRR
jgi:hypothetical protein